MPKFTLYWLTGEKEIVEGTSVEDAFGKTGYSAGAIRALDFHVNGEDDSYTWNPVDKTWTKKLESL